MRRSPRLEHKPVSRSRLDGNRSASSLRRPEEFAWDPTGERDRVSAQLLDDGWTLATEAAAEEWRPWRAYAAVALWRRLGQLEAGATIAV